MDSDALLAAVNHDAELARHVTQEREADAIDHLEDHLRDEFSSIVGETVVDVVERRYHDLDDSPIRDYVPVLVENAAKEDLRSMARQRQHD